ncbi:MULTISPECIES: UvrD-helicase domain-containing protein [Providencia]|uniref:UvrD-helicase domain-containing protein n=1 Tax=Providencia TaxID=586 RepID=UPI0012B57ECB|nr:MULTISPECIES: UvrD-helicase domain-containing protein [Providencia]MTC57433.1 AAA family ATPase [Providencia rustigianii]
MNNKLIIAAAGSGKTNHLVMKALSIKDESVLITTFTEANGKEIANRIIEQKGYLPENITIQTWFSFLLQHGVKPYQSILDSNLDNITIGFYLTSSKSGLRAGIKTSTGAPIYWGEKDVFKHYLTPTNKIYSDKISKFVFQVNKMSNGEVIKRISRIYKHILVDEVQDLAGYDLDIIKLLFSTESIVILVGDPRQVTYLTHFSKRYSKYSNGNIAKFIESELGKKIKCLIDRDTLNASHRNNKKICDFSSKLYPDLPIPTECKCSKCRITPNEHIGVFVIKPSQVDSYLKMFNPLQLRWSSTKKVNLDFQVKNFGESKGLTANRVLIYPTDNMIKWIKDNSININDETRAKLYVGLTRARFSSALVIEYNDDEYFHDVEKYIP